MKPGNRLTNILSDSRFLLLVIGGFILFFFLNSLYRAFDPDEFETIHSAWKILNGEIIYIDFFQHHHPFFYCTIVPLLKIFGENTQSILFIRVIIFIFFILILVITYHIAAELFDSKRIGLISVTFLCSIIMFFNKVIEIRPDVLQVLFGLLAIYFLIVEFKRGSTKYTVLSSLSLGVSFLFLQKAIFLMMGILVLQLFRLYKGKSTFKNIFIYWFSFALSLIPYSYYLLRSGFMTDYILWNWIINMRFTDSFSPLFYLLRSFKINCIVWVFFAGGLIFSRGYISREFCRLSLILLLSVFFVKAPYQQYYMMFFPLMAIVAGYGVVNIIKSNKAVIYIMIIASALPIIYSRNFIEWKNTKQLDKVQYVLSNTTKDDYVYDGKPKFNVFRKDIDFFWYSVGPETGGLATYKLLYPYEYNVYELINKFKPKIISNYYIDNMNNEIITKNYHNSLRYKDILIRND